MGPTQRVGAFTYEKTKCPFISMKTGGSEKSEKLSHGIEEAKAVLRGHVNGGTGGQVLTLQTGPG